jgi:hypothetical protein
MAMVAAGAQKTLHELFDDSRRRAGPHRPATLEELFPHVTVPSLLAGGGPTGARCCSDGNAIEHLFNALGRHTERGASTLLVAEVVHRIGRDRP